MSSFDVWYQDLLCLDLMYDIFICLLYISLITWVTGFSPSLFSDRSKLVARKDFLQKSKVRKMWNMKKAQLLYPSCKNYAYFSYFCKEQKILIISSYMVICLIIFGAHQWELWPKCQGHTITVNMTFHVWSERFKEGHQKLVCWRKELRLCEN